MSFITRVWAPRGQMIQGGVVVGQILSREQGVWGKGRETGRQGGKGREIRRQGGKGDGRGRARKEGRHREREESVGK